MTLWQCSASSLRVYYETRARAICGDCCCDAGIGDSTRHWRLCTASPTMIIPIPKSSIEVELRKKVAPQVAPLTPKKWYEGWSLLTEVYTGNHRRYTFKIPNSNTGKLIVLDCKVDDPVGYLVDALDSALTSLADPLERRYEDKHREASDEQI